MCTCTVEVLHTAVHFAHVIGKHPIGEELFEQLIARRCCVVFFGTEQYELTLRDFADGGLLDFNRGFFDALDEGYHF